MPRRLSIQHAIVHLTHHHMVHAWGYVALGGAATATLVALAVALRRRWPAATVGIGMYLVILLPTSNLKYTKLVELVSERFLYLPVLGLALVAGAALAAADATWRRRGFALAAACGLALGAISASRAADFANEDAFWQREIAMHPDGPQAQQYILDKAILDNQYKAALRILGDMTAAEASYDPAFDRQEMIASYASLALMHLIPDHDPAALRALDTFIKELLAHDRPVARLSVRGVKLAVSMDSPTFAKTLEPYAPALEAYRADIASRLGDDTAALRLAAASRVLCKLCMVSITADALAHARSGRLDVALAIVNQASADVQSRELDLLHQQIERARRDAQTIASTTGTAQLAARGQLLGDLTLWGRAYDTLAPHRTELLQVPDAAKTSPSSRSAPASPRSRATCSPRSRPATSRSTSRCGPMRWAGATTRRQPARARRDRIGSCVWASCSRTSRPGSATSISSACATGGSCSTPLSSGARAGCAATGSSTRRRAGSTSPRTCSTRRARRRFATSSCHRIPTGALTSCASSGTITARPGTTASPPCSTCARGRAAVAGPAVGRAPRARVRAARAAVRPAVRFRDGFAPGPDRRPR